MSKLKLAPNPTGISMAPPTSWSCSSRSPTFCMGPATCCSSASFCPAPTSSPSEWPSPPNSTPSSGSMPPLCWSLLSPSIGSLLCCPRNSKDQRQIIKHNKFKIELFKKLELNRGFISNAIFAFSLHIISRFSALLSFFFSREEMNKTFYLSIHSVLASAYALWMCYYILVASHEVPTK